jgi:hypothetical protein
MSRKTTQALLLAALPLLARGVSSQETGWIWPNTDHTVWVTVSAEYCDANGVPGIATSANPLTSSTGYPVVNIDGGDSTATVTAPPAYSASVAAAASSDPSSPQTTSLQVSPTVAVDPTTTSSADITTTVLEYSEAPTPTLTVWYTPGETSINTQTQISTLYSDELYTKTFDTVSSGVTVEYTTVGTTLVPVTDAAVTTAPFANATLSTFTTTETETSTSSDLTTTITLTSLFPRRQLPRL